MLALPALDGRFALGYLAALGTLQLLDATGRSPALSWSTEDATAQLDCDGVTDVDDLVDVLHGVVESMETATLMPFGPKDFPPQDDGDTARMKLSPAAFRGLAERSSSSAEASNWVASLATDATLDNDKTMATLYAAISGQQTLRTMLEKPLTLVRQNPDYLRQAFTAWRRVDGVSGEYLDHRVLFDAAASPNGKSNERGVPGATWLALMSYPLVRTTTVDGQRPMSTGWFRDGRRIRMRWGLWAQPLDLTAVRTLWESPLLTQACGTDPVVNPTDRIDVRRANRGRQDRIRQARHGVQAMGVFYLARAERQKIPGRTFAGVLAPDSTWSNPLAPSA